MLAAIGLIVPHSTIQAQRNRDWGKHIENSTTVDNASVRVGVLGFGVMGRAAAEALAMADYPVSLMQRILPCRLWWWLWVRYQKGGRDLIPYAM